MSFQREIQGQSIVSESIMLQESHCHNNNKNQNQCLFRCPNYSAQPINSLLQFTRSQFARFVNFWGYITSFRIPCGCIRKDRDIQTYPTRQLQFTQLSGPPFLTPPIKWIYISGPLLIAKNPSMMMNRARPRKVHFNSQSPELLAAFSAQEYDRSAVQVSRLTYKDMEELIRLRGEYRRAHDQMMRLAEAMDFESDASSSTSERQVLP